MPNRDGTGPRRSSRGTRDGRGKGKRIPRSSGTGRKTGGKKGNC